MAQISGSFNFAADGAGCSAANLMNGNYIGIILRVL